MCEIFYKRTVQIVATIPHYVAAEMLCLCESGCLCVLYYGNKLVEGKLKEETLGDVIFTIIV